MTLLAILAALALLVAPLVLGVTSYFRINTLVRRLGYIERTLDGLKSGAPTPQQSTYPPARDDATPSAKPQDKPASAVPTTSPPLPVRKSPPQSPQPTSPAPEKTASTPKATPLPSSSKGLEERLGTQWAVWVGGAALALGGLFLVKYTIDSGLLSPAVRIALAALLAAALIAGGEWLRRGEITLRQSFVPSAHIPSILTAAGTTIAFGTIYAAHALYGFIGPGAAFVLLGATGLAAMVASALHGPWLAGLGLAGAFVTPLLISSDTPNPWPVVMYLAVVAASAYALARTRRWLWLAIAALSGALLWGVLLLDIGGAANDATSLLSARGFHALIQLALACLAFAVDPHGGRRDSDAKLDRIASIALACLAALIVLVVWMEVPNANVVIAAIATAVLLATAWRAAPSAVAVALAGLITAGLMIGWPGLNDPISASLTAPELERLLRLPDNVTHFITIATLLSGAACVVGMLRVWKGPLLPITTAGALTAGAVLTPIVALILGYLRLAQFETSIAFSLAALSLAALYATSAATFDAAERAYAAPSHAIATGVAAAAAIAALALAMTFGLSRGYLTVALSLAALGTAYIASLRNIPLLRGAVTALGLIVLARVIYDPQIMGDDVGTTPFFNWLLLGYGVPLVSFALAGRLLETRASDRAVRVADSLAVIFAGLLGFFQIRHLVNDGDVFAFTSGHVEVGLTTLLALGLSYTVARLHAQKSNPVFDYAATVLGALALVIAGFGLAIAVNPYFTGQRVTGQPLFGSLTLGYLLPGVASLFVARHLRDYRPEWYLRAMGTLAVALLFAYVTLAVRQGFHGHTVWKYLRTSDAEHWAYSLSWLALGIALLGYGLVRHSLEARMASAALIALAAAKVTLFDLAGIGGVWRAFSFLSLGAVLIGIGLVYQRYIFVEPADQAPGRSDGSD